MTVNFEQDDYERNRLADEGTLASELSSRLDETEDDEFEQITVYTWASEFIGSYDHLSELPPVEPRQKFRAWSENFVWYSHAESMAPSRIERIYRNPSDRLVSRPSFGYANYEENNE